MPEGTVSIGNGRHVILQAGAGPAPLLQVFTLNIPYKPATVILPSKVRTFSFVEEDVMLEPASHMVVSQVCDMQMSHYGPQAMYDGGALDAECSRQCTDGRDACMLDFRMHVQVSLTAHRQCRTWGHLFTQSVWAMAPTWSCAGCASATMPVNNNSGTSQCMRSTMPLKRDGLPHADEPDGTQAVLDMGTLVDAIHVGNGSHLELRRLRIPNCASRHVRASPPPRVRLRVAGIFALWPSVTLAINSSVSTLRSATLHVGCPLL